MTSLIAWTGVDSRGPASFYMASDSRISWRSLGSTASWDFARKVFASTRHPDVLGYCGQVLFISQVLGQLIDLIDADALFEAHATPQFKFDAICTVFKQVYSTYAQPGDTVIHCSRHGEGMSASFRLFELRWDSTGGWLSREVSVPTRSDIVAAYGSGAASVGGWVKRWKGSDVGGTSRSIFSAFCDSLSSHADPASGGAPQLVGLYRKGAAESFGAVFKGTRFLHGLCVDQAPWLGGVEWRNELFERCDWRTGERLVGAQRQPRPTRLRNTTG